VPPVGWGIVGVYIPQDPGAATETAKQGRYAFNYGQMFDKGISMGQGQCPVKHYNRQLRDLIIRGRAKPSVIVSHELPAGGRPRGLR
jgi:glutathione-independent formaldehyde dehydrogenase